MTMPAIYSEKMHKVTREYARWLYANARNNGERVEALTLLQFNCTLYNPTLKGSLGGDVYGPTCGHMQVKAFDGTLTLSHIATGDIAEDLRRHFEEDASPYWVIWPTHDEYLHIEKWELYKLLTGRLMEDLIKYETRNGKKNLRLKMGPLKRKFLMNKLEKRTVEV